MSDFESNPTALADRQRDQAPKIGRFNYLSSKAEHSLFRNGKVLTRRDADGSDAGGEGVEREPWDMPVVDARQLDGGDRRTVASNGFELLDSPLEHPSLDFLVHDQVVGRYYPHCAEIVKAATGAAHVIAFDHNVRSAAGKESNKRIRGGQQVQGPAHLVHGDYTLTSAPQRLRELGLPPSGNDTFRDHLGVEKSLLSPELVDRGLAPNGRFAIINLWRNITDEPVVTHPLALCDAQCVTPRDLVVFEIHYRDRVGENYFSKHAATHRWYYYPEMTRDEPLLIKQWDSAGPLASSQGVEADGSDPSRPATFSFHSAFEDPATPSDAPERWSVEVRCVVIYD